MFNVYLVLLSLDSVAFGIALVYRRTEVMFYDALLIALVVLILNHKHANLKD